MPKVRLTYQKDIDREGADVIEVDDGRARVLVNQRRAVVIEPADELAAMKKAELAAHAAEIGVEVDPKATKPEIVKAIQAGQRA